MSRPLTRTRFPQDPGESPEPESPRFPWKCFAAALISTALLVYYLTFVAPALLPVSPRATVPVPAAVPYVEQVCAWCGEHTWVAVVIGLLVWLAGAIVPSAAKRYYVGLATVAILMLALAFTTVSTPFDRVAEAVEGAIPEDHRVPSFGSGDQD